MRGLRKEGLSRGGKDSETQGANDARGVGGGGPDSLTLYPNCDPYHSPRPLLPPYARGKRGEGLGSFSARYPTG